LRDEIEAVGVDFVQREQIVTISRPLFEGLGIAGEVLFVDHEQGSAEQGSTIFLHLADAGAARVVGVVDDRSIVERAADEPVAEVVDIRNLRREI